MISKKFLYHKERIIILRKLYDILGIDNNNITIILSDIESDEKIQQKILALTDDIKKYFSTAHWHAFKKGNNDVAYYYRSLIRCLLKDMDIKFCLGSQLINGKSKSVIVLIHWDSAFAT